MARVAAVDNGLRPISIGVKPQSAPSERLHGSYPETALWDGGKCIVPDAQCITQDLNQEFRSNFGPAQERDK